MRLAQAQVGSFIDSALLWDAVDGLDLDGFDYQKLNNTHVIDTRQRLAWLERVMPDFAPGPYEQLAVNLGQDGYWRLEGASQWIGGGLVAAGWILATTAAAGAARILKRV